MQNIMVATDGSDGANRAIDIGAEIAKALNGTLSIVTVGRALSEEEKAHFEQVEGNVADPAEVLAQRALYDAEQRAQRAGIASPKTILVWGDAAESIIETIQRERADAIVVGRRGRGQISGILLGSISQELARTAPCVVIVAP